MFWSTGGTAAARRVGAVVLAVGLALTLWLVHHAMRAVAAGRLQQEQLSQALSGRTSERDEARRQTQQAQVAAKAADPAGARVLAAVSHDLRQPA